MIFEMDGMEIREVCFWMQSTYFIKYYIMEYVSRKNLQECRFFVLPCNFTVSGHAKSGIVALREAPRTRIF
ncbi:MAG: hypothetical protein A2W38_04450 [Deltaproteobacteria bacterium RBG_19FT_COMBO_58_16]|nr:MAG: hypothetical protein A2W38_04450 [Deltaproteobacteria bacterium RBG_19FT_COMBO_58_16]